MSGQPPEEADNVVSATERCPDCGRQVTRGSSGVEYGHERGRGDNGQRPRCPRRPECVDPGREGPDHDGWCLPGGETQRIRTDGGTDTATGSIEQYDRPLDALAHRLWTHWSQHIAEEEDISEERLQRWRDLWIPYGDLSEGAKETDRRLVERFCEKEPEYNRSVDVETDHGVQEP